MREALLLQELREKGKDLEKTVKKIERATKSPVKIHSYFKVRGRSALFKLNLFQGKSRLSRTHLIYLSQRAIHPSTPPHGKRREGLISSF